MSCFMHAWEPMIIFSENRFFRFFRFFMHPNRFSDIYESSCIFIYIQQALQALNKHLTHRRRLSSLPMRAASQAHWSDDERDAAKYARTTSCSRGSSGSSTCHTGWRLRVVEWDNVQFLPPLPPLQGRLPPIHRQGAHALGSQRSLRHRPNKE